MPEVKINWIQRLDPTVECMVLETRSRSGQISVNLDDIMGDCFVESKAVVVAAVELAGRDFDKLCFHGLTSHDYPFISQVYGRKRKIQKNEAGKKEFEVIRVENEKMDWLYMAVRENGCIPLFSTQLLNMETFKTWKQKFDDMEKFVNDNLIGYLEKRLCINPDLSLSSAELLLAAVRDGWDWRPLFEDDSSLFDVVLHYISSSIDKAVEKYLEAIYGKKQELSIKEAKGR